MKKEETKLREEKLRIIKIQKSRSSLKNKIKLELEEFSLLVREENFLKISLVIRQPDHRKIQYQNMIESALGKLSKSLIHTLRRKKRKNGWLCNTKDMIAWSKLNIWCRNSQTNNFKEMNMRRLPNFSQKIDFSRNVGFLKHRQNMKNQQAFNMQIDALSMEQVAK